MLVRSLLVLACGCAPAWSADSRTYNAFVGRSNELRVRLGR
jgi:hypothetical protein